MPVALDLAIETDRTAYDSLYLALAMLTQCQLVTADSKLLNALVPGDYADHVVWVEAVNP